MLDAHYLNEMHYQKYLNLFDASTYSNLQKI